MAAGEGGAKHIRCAYDLDKSGNYADGPWACQAVDRHTCEAAVTGRACPGILTNMMISINLIGERTPDRAAATAVPAREARDVAGIRYLYGSPTSSYLICTTPRSGSTFLSEALASTGVAGRPEEYFQQLPPTGIPRRPVDYLGPDLAAAELPEAFSAPDGDFRVELLFDPRRFGSFGDYVTWVIGTATTSNGVFGAKIMAAYLEGLAAGLRDALGDRCPATLHEIVAAAFPRLRYVRLVRADKVRQAVSLWRAIQTWQWREDAAPGAVAAANGGGLRYSFPVLDHLRRGLEGEEEWWDAYFEEAGIEPLTIVYEDFSGQHDRAVRAVLRHLEIPFEDAWGLPSPTMRRQADTLSEEWAERYEGDRAAVAAGDVA